MGSPNYYVILEVKRSASQAELKAAYRRLARRYHPDQNQGDPEAEERFKRVAAAYEVLGDPQRRLFYDRFGSDRPFSQGMPPNMHRVSPLAVVVKQGVEALRDRLGQRRGADLRITVSLSFEEALCGTSRVLALPRARSNNVIEERHIEFRLPADLSDGQVLRWAGFGGPGKRGGPRGDLYVTVAVADHPLFRISSRQLEIPLPVRQSEVGRRRRFEIPTLYGLHTLKLDEDVRHGQRITVAEAGRPVQGGRRRPLIVEVVTDDGALSPEAFEALEQRFARYVDALRKRAR